MYEIWYIPRIEDELVVARFDTEEQAKSAMADLKDKRPKAYPHHYIWDSKNKVKIEEGRKHGINRDNLHKQW